MSPSLATPQRELTDIVVFGPTDSGEIGPERAGTPPQTSPLPPERELRQFLGQPMLLDRSTESLCDAK